MRTASWTMGLLGTVALAAGCATSQPKAASPQGEQASAAQTQSEQSLQKAIDAQKQATEMQNTARKSQLVVQEKQKELADAQSKAAAANQNAQQAQKEADDLRARANEEAGQAQKEALNAQGEQANQGAVPEMPSANSNAVQTEGTLSSINGDDVSVARPDQLPMKIHVAAHVPVTLDGKPIALSALPQGSDVRVSYQQGPDKLEATRIDATSVGPANQPSAPPAPQDQSPQNQ